MIGCVLKEARESINISQSKLAEIVGVTKQTYLKWENDVTEPKASQVSKLATALRISEMEICRGKLNNRMSFEEFVTKISKINVGSSLNLLITWELIDDHAEFISQLKDGEISN